MMNDHRLIHMNARLYDMETARFLSADSVIPEPDLYGAYNRYIYVLNNPLKYHDPSGHFWNFIAGAVISFIASQSSNSTLRLIGSVASMYLMGPASMSSGFTIGNAFTHSFTAGFVNSGFQSGSLQWAVLGGMSNFLTTGIGHGGINGSPLLGKDWFATAILHGVAQGTMASLRGGNFKEGLSSGFIGSVLAHNTGEMLKQHSGAHFAITITMGGLTSQATGGSFNDGVISSATVFLFNKEVQAKLLTVKDGLDHSAVWIADGGDGKPVLYDPAGSQYQPKGPGPEVPYDPNALDPVAMRQAGIFTGKYANVGAYVVANNNYVSITAFSVDMSSAKAMVSEMYRLGNTAPLTCAASVGSVIRSAGGVYKDVSPIINHPALLEGSLERAIK